MWLTAIAAHSINSFPIWYTAAPMTKPTYSAMRRAHQIIGGVTLAVFAASGIYVRVKAPSIYLGDEVSHIMFIANHIYILMAGLANVAIGRYAVPVEDKNGRLMQSLGLASMMAASGMLVYAFLTEPALGSFERVRTQIGVMLLTLGTALHVFSGIPGQKKGRK